MDRFVDRKSELDELNRLSQSATGVFLSVYGRRRVGKTTLLLHWAKQTGLPYMYWWRVVKRQMPPGKAWRGPCGPWPTPKIKISNPALRFMGAAPARDGQADRQSTPDHHFR